MGNFLAFLHSQTCWRFNKIIILGVNHNDGDLIPSLTIRKLVQDYNMLFLKPLKAVKIEVSQIPDDQRQALDLAEELCATICPSATIELTIHNRHDDFPDLNFFDSIRFLKKLEIVNLDNSWSLTADIANFIAFASQIEELTVGKFDLTMSLSTNPELNRLKVGILTHDNRELPKNQFGTIRYLEIRTNCQVSGLKDNFPNVSYLGFEDHVCVRSFFSLPQNLISLKIDFRSLMNVASEAFLNLQELCLHLPYGYSKKLVGMKAFFKTSADSMPILKIVKITLNEPYLRKSSFKKLWSLTKFITNHPSILVLSIRVSAMFLYRTAYKYIKRRKILQNLIESFSSSSLVYLNFCDIVCISGDMTAEISRRINVLDSTYLWDIATSLKCV